MLGFCERTLTAEKNRRQRRTYEICMETCVSDLVDQVVLSAEMWPL